MTDEDTRADSASVDEDRLQMMDKISAHWLLASWWICFIPTFFYCLLIFMQCLR